jgi:hypothetical protein
MQQENFKNKMTPLINEHFDKFKFNLMLKHKESGMYVGRDGLVNEHHRANYFECGAEGQTVKFLYDWEIEQCGNEWIEQYTHEEFVIESALGEM